MHTPDTNTASVAEVTRLIMRLVSLGEKWPSAPFLSALSPRMINGLLTYNNRLERGYPMLRVIAVSLCGIMLWLCGTNPELWLMLALPALIILSWAYINDAVPQYRCAAYALTQTDDLRILPMLLLATRHAWGKHPEVLRAISRLLVQVTEAEVGLLNDKRQERLWRLAVPSLYSAQPFDEALTLRALQALALIGNRNSLRQMQTLGAATCAYAHHQRIIAKARELAPLMEARLQRQEVPETLLRAANTPASQTETLLRAVHATTSESRQQLLRASTGEERER